MGLVTRTGHGYGLLQARVRVGKFPPARNPYPQGGLYGLPRVFFSLILQPPPLLLPPPLVPGHRHSVLNSVLNGQRQL